jgi:hypothetical protein
VLSLWVFARTIPTVHPFTHPPRGGRCGRGGAGSRLQAPRSLWSPSCCVWKRVTTRVAPTLSRSAVRLAKAVHYPENDGSKPEAVATGGQACDRKAQSPIQPFTPPVRRRRNCRHLIKDVLAKRRIDVALLDRAGRRCLRPPPCPGGVKTVAGRPDLPSPARQRGCRAGAAQPACDCRAMPAPLRNVSSPAGWLQG